MYQVECQREGCAKTHEAEFSHEGQYNEGPIFAVVCDDGLTDYYTNEFVQEVRVITPWMMEMIGVVKAHAIKHYNENGWDVIVECYTDEMIEEILRKNAFQGTVRSANGAIKRVGAVAKMTADYRADMMATAF